MREKKESICAYTVQCDMHIFFNSNRKIKLVSSFPLVRELCSNGGESDETLICQQASNRMTLAHEFFCAWLPWNYGYQKTTVLLYFCCDKKQI